ncbi:MAG: hypothetical protein ACXABY_07295 [Candidatus Thorarchaeota archaeon]|jgi:hypothetical protein
MAKVDQTTQLDVSNKQTLGVTSSTNARNYFEEPFAFINLSISSQILGQDVLPASNPSEADGNVVIQPGIIQKLTDYQMDEVPGSNGEAYATYTTPTDTNSVRLFDWLTPQVFGLGYAVSLKEQDNTVINLTDGAFQVDYTNGIVRFDPTNRPADLSYALPLKITLYRYIGLKGVVTGAVGGAGSVVRSYDIGVGLLDPVYQKSDGNVAKADATSLATGRVLGIVTAIDVPMSGDATITYLGDVGGFAGFTPGELLLLGTAPGSIVSELDTLNVNYPDQLGNIIHELGTIGPSSVLFVNTTRDFGEI